MCGLKCLCLRKLREWPPEPKVAGSNPAGRARCTHGPGSLRSVSRFCEAPSVGRILPGALLEPFRHLGQNAEGFFQFKFDTSAIQRGVRKYGVQELPPFGIRLRKPQGFGLPSEFQNLLSVGEVRPVQLLVGGFELLGTPGALFAQTLKLAPIRGCGSLVLRLDAGVRLNVACKLSHSASVKTRSCVPLYHSVRVEGTSFQRHIF